jgi:diaminopimelate epimerase
VFSGFRQKLQLIDNDCSFNAIDGLHNASITEDGIVSLQMIDVTDIKRRPYYIF